MGEVLALEARPLIGRHGGAAGGSTNDGAVAAVSAVVADFGSPGPKKKVKRERRGGSEEGGGGRLGATVEARSDDNEEDAGGDAMDIDGTVTSGSADKCENADHDQDRDRDRAADGGLGRDETVLAPVPAMSAKALRKAFQWLMRRCEHMAGQLADAAGNDTPDDDEDGNAGVEDDGGGDSSSGGGSSAKTTPPNSLARDAFKRVRATPTTAYRHVAVTRLGHLSGLERGLLVAAARTRLCAAAVAKAEIDTAASALTPGKARVFASIGQGGGVARRRLQRVTLGALQAEDGLAIPDELQEAAIPGCTLIITPVAAVVTAPGGEVVNTNPPSGAANGSGHRQGQTIKGVGGGASPMTTTMPAVGSSRGTRVMTAVAAIAAATACDIASTGDDTGKVSGDPIAALLSGMAAAVSVPRSGLWAHARWSGLDTAGVPAVAALTVRVFDQLSRPTAIRGVAVSGHHGGPGPSAGAGAVAIAGGSGSGGGDNNNNNNDNGKIDAPRARARAGTGATVGGVRAFKAPRDPTASEAAAGLVRWYTRLGAMGTAMGGGGEEDGDEPAPPLPPHAAAAARFAALLTRVERVAASYP